MTQPEKIPPTGVVNQLMTKGYQFDFFQAVRLLEMSASDREPVGHDAVPQKEVIRFGAHPSVEFPASEIYEIDQKQKPDRPSKMTVTFFGLFGPMGALPLHYTEMIIEQLSRKDRTLLEFLDLFNHRLISLFYRAWEKYQFWVIGERALRQERIAIQSDQAQFRSFVLDRRPKLDPLGQVLLSLIGLGSPATRYSIPHRDRLKPRTEIPDQTWRFYAGLLSLRNRPASSLESMLSDHFNWPVKVQPLCGRWLQLETADQTRLKFGGNTKLGKETVAGRKVWEIQGKFRLRIGPVNYDQFCSLLPIGNAHRPFIQMTRFHVGQYLDYDLDLQLRSSEIPVLRCGDKTGIGARLGWNTWLRTRKFPSAVASVKLQPSDAGLES